MATENSNQKKWKVTVEPFGPSHEQFEKLKSQLQQHPELKLILTPDKSRLLHLNLVHPTSKETTGNGKLLFRATYYDYAMGHAVIVEGDPDSPSKLKIIKSAVQPLPSVEEYQEALAILHEDKDIAEQLKSKKWRPYKAMPGIRSNILPDGRTTRILTLGLYPEGHALENEIVGIDLLNRTVIRDDDTFEAPTEALKRLVMHFNPEDFIFPFFENNSNHIWVFVHDHEGNEIWRMLVYRAPYSSGINGSGLDLWYVDYRRRRVLYQAHVPILDVLYDQNIQEYRDWETEETGFNAVGVPFKDNSNNNISGFMNCTAPPTTIFDTGSEGNFYGVAVYLDNANNLSLTTMIGAGWYRYFMAYSFYTDGTIKPRVGFTTSGANPYANTKHVHHAYFRFDFDIGQEFWNNSVFEHSRHLQLQQFGSINIVTTDTLVQFETKKYRSQFNIFFGPSSYKIMDTTNNVGYFLHPGAVDGTATNDNFGSGDIWILKYHGNEIDDGVQQLTKPAKAQLDKFINGESVHKADVVIWYAVHFLHDPSQTKGENDFGPTLEPAKW